MTVVFPSGADLPPERDGVLRIIGWDSQNVGRSQREASTVRVRFVLSRELTATEKDIYPQLLSMAEIQEGRLLEVSIRAEGATQRVHMLNNRLAELERKSREFDDAHNAAVDGVKQALRGINFE